MQHLLDITDFSPDALRSFLRFAQERTDLLKAEGEAALGYPLRGKSLAMVFQKQSLRTRVSFQRAIEQLGGHAMYLSPTEVGMGKREAVQDVARVLGRMCDAIMARVFTHEDVVALSRYAGVPVINGLSDLTHPCQTLADLMTLAQRWGGVDKLAGHKVAYLGDPNNVARPLAVACGMLGMHFTLAAPPQRRFTPDFAKMLQERYPRMQFVQSSEVATAVKGADCLYTDTWVSMGQEEEKEARLREFAGYAINAACIAATGRKTVILHCLPAYRGCEITDEALEHPDSAVFDQAENRLHVQRALLEMLLKNTVG